jgi:hypothetical protein
MKEMKLSILALAIFSAAVAGAQGPSNFGMPSKAQLRRLTIS